MTFLSGLSPAVMLDDEIYLVYTRKKTAKLVFDLIAMFKGASHTQCA